MKQLRLPLLRSIFFLMMISMMSCHPKSTKDNTSRTGTSCMESKLEAFKKTACANGASLKEYVFQGKTVYAFEPGTCGADLTTEVLDAKCQSLGFLGGITGNTRINNEDFSKAELKRTLWENESR